MGFSFGSNDAAEGWAKLSSKRKYMFSAESSVNDRGSPSSVKAPGPGTPSSVRVPGLGTVTKESRFPVAME